jgi:tetratricopeptide (TPR) repeat protein
LKKALHSEPLDPWTLTFTSYAEMQLGKYDEAIANAGKVHALPHNGFADAHLILARSFETLDHRQEALEQYNLYLAEDPKGSNASFARVVVQRLSTLAVP